MADALTTITDFIIKPSAPFAAGLVLFGAVWAFFKGVEGVLNDDTKLKIAVWLLGVRVGQKVEPWPDTFARIFDRVFGEKHLSLGCFVRSALASVTAFILVLTVRQTLEHISGHSLSEHSSRGALGESVYFLQTASVNIVPDYVSLLVSRRILEWMRLTQSSLIWTFFLILDFAVTFLIAGIVVAYAGTLWLLDRGVGVRALIEGAVAVSVNLWTSIQAFRFDSDFQAMWFYPAFFTSVWLWLYPGSGFLLKGARRFDIGFQWFNRTFDIEKHPLSSIGLVSATLMALIYWTAVIVSRIL